MKWPWVKRTRLDTAIIDFRLCRHNNDSLNHRLQLATEGFSRLTAELLVVEGRLREERQRHAEELERVKSDVSKLVDRAVTIDWDRDDGSRYGVKVSFDARAFAPGCQRESEQRLIAWQVARRVESQIVNAQFIGRADDFERERLNREYRFHRKAWDPVSRPPDDKDLE
jgi:hypothetical protein